jgi:hypothetical protein
VKVRTSSPSRVAIPATAERFAESGRDPEGGQLLVDDRQLLGIQCLGEPVADLLQDDNGTMV